MIATEDIVVSNRNFVCLNSRFLQNGTYLLSESIRNSVKAVFGKVNLQEPTSQILLESLFTQIRHEIESSCGRSLLDDCVFGRLEDLVSSEMSAIRRRLFIAMINEARIRMKSEFMKKILFDQVSKHINQFLKVSLGTGENPPPFLAIIPKFSNYYKEGFEPEYEWLMQLKRMAAAVFVDDESDIIECLLQRV